MNIKEIKEIVEMIDNSSLTEFEYENSGAKLILKKEKNMVIESAASSIEKNQVKVPKLTEIRETNYEEDEIIDSNFSQIISPIVGTYYSSPSPESEPFIKIGAKVKKGSVLCIIEAMKVMNEIIAEFDCVIEKILVNNEEMVEYARPLFLVKPL